VKVTITDTPPTESLSGAVEIDDRGGHRRKFAAWWLDGVERAPSGQPTEAMARA